MHYCQSPADSLFGNKRPFRMRIRSCNDGPGAAIPVNGVGHTALDPMHERVDRLEEALAFVRLSNFAVAFARPAPTVFVRSTAVLRQCSEELLSPAYRTLPSSISLWQE